MNNRFLATFAIGIGVIGIIVAGVLYMQRGARIGLAGSFLKVRTAPLDENSTIAVIDFRFANPGNVPFWVRTVSLVMEDKDGSQYEGKVISEGDAKQLFQALPLLGQKFNDTLVLRDKIPGHTSEDRMVAARFEAPEARIASRKRFLVRIEEVDGPITELSEK
ncbi:MAG TPA: hypothetical protein VGH38_23905 [Bryobacteraceae bacterium]|jgi:hypothetical protein